MIMDKCDHPGVFRCEALIRAWHFGTAEVPVRGEFDGESTEEGKVPSTCMTSSFFFFKLKFIFYFFSLKVARKIYCNFIVIEIVKLAMNRDLH